MIWMLEEEACERVWLHRKTLDDYYNPSIRPVIDRILNKYNLEFGKQDNFDYNFWEGVLAVTRLLTYNIDAKEFKYDEVGVEAIRDYGYEYGFLDT